MSDACPDKLLLLHGLVDDELDAANALRAGGASEDLPGLRGGAGADPRAEGDPGRPGAALCGARTAARAHRRGAGRGGRAAAGPVAATCRRLRGSAR